MVPERNRCRLQLVRKRASEIDDAGGGETRYFKGPRIVPLNRILKNLLVSLGLLRLLEWDSYLSTRGKKSTSDNSRCI